MLYWFAAILLRVQSVLYCLCVGLVCSLGRVSSPFLKRAVSRWQGAALSVGGSYPKAA